MVVVRILDNNEVEYGVYIYENNENGEVFVQDDFHCSAEEDGFDTIFGTNDEQVTVQINPTKFIAKSIVDHIVSCHLGETYNEGIARNCIADTLCDVTQEILEHIDEIMMEKYLKEDLTIKEK